MAETDESLYSRYLDGEEDALRILLERHREGLTAFLAGFVHDLDDAEELMLDAFAAAFAERARFSGRSSFKTWLFGIGRNLALKHLRTQKRRKSLHARAEEPEGPIPPEQQLLMEERRSELYAALQALPEPYGQTLLLLELEGMSVEETAGVMHKSKKQIYNLAFRGRQALKAELERRGVTDAQYG